MVRLSNEIYLSCLMKVSNEIYALIYDLILHEITYRMRSVLQLFLLLLTVSITQLILCGWCYSPSAYWYVTNEFSIIHDIIYYSYCYTFKMSLVVDDFFFLQPHDILSSSVVLIF